MNPESSKTKMVAALGRPFSLGMLYDCRRDLLIPGMTLWDSDALKNNITQRAQSYNDFETVSSESIADKSSALNVEASLKASFLSGLVDVEGSAKYLHDDKTSNNQARVTLKYEATTKFQELSMDHLGRGNMKYPYVFDQGLATHVVTGILYGAKAFFVFDRDVAEDEKHQDIEGYLKVMINKIPSVSIGGSGSVKLEDTDIKKVETFSCKFHGDFLLDKTPTTFLEAVNVYQSLPELLGEDGVPVKVWLLPLANLDSSAAKLVREISAVFVEDAEAVLEDLKEVEIRCNDALKSSVTQQFPDIARKLKRFKEKCSEFKIEFQRSLAKMLPSIRGGGQEESELAQVLEKRMSSPFSHTKLNEWLDRKVREVYTVMSFTNMMKSSKITTSQNELFREVLSAETAVCYVFTSLGHDEPYLSDLSNYLNETTNDSQDPQTDDVEKEEWFASKDVGNEMKRKAKLFSDFAEANKEEKNLKFLTVALTDTTQNGSSIYLYENGFSVSQNFEPPSEPESVTAADRSHDSVTLKISPPRFGADNVSSYSVEFCVVGQDGWKLKTGPRSGDVTVSELSPNTEYLFRCRAVTSVGLGPAHELSDPIKTLPCSPPENPHTESGVCEISVSWDRPSELGQDVQIFSYIVEFAVKNQVDQKWTRTRSETQAATLFMLPPNTEYAVRVICDCGGAGRSKESTTVFCTTPDTHLSLLQEVLHDYPDLETRCRNAHSSSTLQHFPQMEQKLQRFEEQCEKFREEMLQQLKENAPLILSKQDKQLLIINMTGKRNSTLFKERDLRMWIQWKEKEIQVVQSLIDLMKNTKVISLNSDLDKICDTTEKVLSFVFTSLADDEPYLAALSQHVDLNLQDPVPKPNVDLNKWVPWFQEIQDQLSQKAKHFGDFAEANKEDKDVKFLTLGSTDKTHKGSAICFFYNGQRVSDDFHPPSEPGLRVISDLLNFRVVFLRLEISPPRFGADSVKSYLVESCVHGEDEWKQTTAPSPGEVTLSHLRANTEYLFRCRAVTQAGAGPACEAISARTLFKYLGGQMPPDISPVPVGPAENLLDKEPL